MWVIFDVLALLIYKMSQNNPLFLITIRKKINKGNKVPLLLIIIILNDELVLFLKQFFLLHLNFHFFLYP